MYTILHVANFSDRLKGAGFAAIQHKLNNGFVRAGHHVVSFSDRDAARAATPLLSRKVGRRGANRRLLTLVDTLRPDIVLFGHADTIQAETVAAIRDRLPGVRMAQWNVDPLFDPDNMERLHTKAALVDWSFVTTGGPLLRQVGDGGHNVAFMPNAADPSIECHRAFAARHSDWDILYAVGSPHFARNHCGRQVTPETLVTELRASLPDQRFLTPGIGMPHLQGAAFGAALATARIGLNISRRNDVFWYSSDRMAHLAGNGLLVAMERASGFGHLFGEDEIAFYDGPDELAGLLRRLLHDDSEWRAMAERGWRAYHAMFGATRVAEYLLGVLDGRVDPQNFDWRNVAANRESSFRHCA